MNNKKNVYIYYKHVPKTCHNYCKKNWQDIDDNDSSPLRHEIFICILAPANQVTA